MLLWIIRHCPCLSHLLFFDTLWTAKLLCSWNFLGKDNWCGFDFLLQGIFPTQGSKLGLFHLLHWQVDSFPLSHLGKLNYLYSCPQSSVQSLCLTFCSPMDCSISGLPVHHQFQEFTQIHVHWVSNAIQPSHPLSSPSPSAFNLSQHQGLFQWVSSLHHVAKILEFQLQHQSF